MSNNTAIIMSGGGMTCSYGVGALLALVEKYNFKQPSMLISGSGSAGGSSYYVSGQYESIRNAWSNLLSSKRFLNLFRLKKIIDINYLIDDVFKKQDRLNEENVYNSKTTFLIPATNFDTGEVDYFSNKNRDDVYEAMRATKAIPVAFNRKVIINGKKYCDSFLSQSTKLNALKAIELGIKKLIIIDNDLPSLGIRLFFQAWLSLRSKQFRNNYQNTFKKIRKIKFPADVQVIYLRPKKKLRVTVLDNNQKKLREAIKQGFDETCSDITLMKFMEEQVMTID